MGIFEGHIELIFLLKSQKNVKVISGESRLDFIKIVCPNEKIGTLH